MKTLSSNKDLVQYGINPLTGEACAYSMRVLCDLSDDGVDLLCEFMGLPHGETVFAKNWNSMVGTKPAVASIMIDRSAFLSLMRFALLAVDHVDVIVVSPDGTLTGLTTSDKYYDRYIDLAIGNSEYTVLRNHKSTAPGKGSRNEHIMTGRTE